MEREREICLSPCLPNRFLKIKTGTDKINRKYQKDKHKLHLSDVIETFSLFLFMYMYIQMFVCIGHTYSKGMGYRSKIPFFFLLRMAVGVFADPALLAPVSARAQCRPLCVDFLGSTVDCTLARSSSRIITHCLVKVRVCGLPASLRSLPLPLHMHQLCPRVPRGDPITLPALDSVHLLLRFPLVSCLVKGHVGL